MTSEEYLANQLEDKMAFKPETGKTYRNTLSISLTNGQSINFSLNDWDTNEQARGGWLEFYAWYFESNDPQFIVIYANGETLIRRETIESFDVKIV